MGTAALLSQPGRRRRRASCAKNQSAFPLVVWLPPRRETASQQRNCPSVFKRGTVRFLRSLIYSWESLIPHSPLLRPPHPPSPPTPRPRTSHSPVPLHRHSRQPLQDRRPNYGLTTVPPLPPLQRFVPPSFQDGFRGNHPRDVTKGRPSHVPPCSGSCWDIRIRVCTRRRGLYVCTPGNCILIYSHFFTWRLFKVFFFLQEVCNPPSIHCQHCLVLLCFLCS